LFARRRRHAAAVPGRSPAQASDQGSFRQWTRLYDIGVGAARYKDEWADAVQPLFDSFIAFKPHGLTLTLPRAALLRLKRAIKSNQYLWPLAQKLRTRLLGKAEPSA
ncbi:MAG: hypothetical protein ACREC3_03840, partial [Methyloceanibacter sp.]